jgi:DNA-directed RNA polymerase subunit RPC12/RpoP
MKLMGIACPNCGKKTLSHPMHPHAYGWKETDKIVCRSCGSRFKIKPPKLAQPAQADDNSKEE